MLISEWLNCVVVVLFMQIRDEGQRKGEASPYYLAELLRLEEQAKEEGLGCWSKDRYEFDHLLIFDYLDH